MIDQHHGWNTSFKPIVLGFILSIILVLAAYRIATHYHLSEHILTMTLITLGCVQALLQFVFFLHLGLESKPRWNLMTFFLMGFHLGFDSRPRWNLMTFFLMVFITFILVGGSLWIMHNLKYNLSM